MALFRWRPVASSVLFLYLLVLFAIVVVGCDRTRHHRHDEDEQDIYVAQLESSVVDETSETSAATSCPTCVYKTTRNLKAESDNLRLEAIKRQILSKLGLRNKPNVTYSLPRDVILQTISRAEDNWKFHDYDEEETITTSDRTTNSVEMIDTDDFYARTSEIISFGEGVLFNGNKYLEFRLAEPGQTLQELRVREATLWLKTELRKRPRTRCQQYLWAFRVRPLSVTTKLSLDENDFGTRFKVTENNSGWQKLNLTDTVRRWLSEGGSTQLTLLIDCSCRCKSVRLHIPESSSSSRSNDRTNDPNRPFLVIHTEPTTTRRVRRRAIDCSPESGNQCCKQRFYVSFKEIGWDDWVIAPRGYYANYCRGDCGSQRTPDQYLNYHTHVIEELRRSNHLSGMQPCCAPLKFSGMSLIYVGTNQNIIKRDLPKMVVDECGCP